MKTPVQLTFSKDTLITHELLDCSGSNQVVRAPTPLTKDVSRVYPPIPLSSSLSLLSVAPLLPAPVAFLLFFVALLLAVGCFGRVVTFSPSSCLPPCSSPVYPLFEFVWFSALSDFCYPLPCALLPSVSIVLRSGPVLPILDCPILLRHCPDSFPSPRLFLIYHSRLWNT